MEVPRSLRFCISSLGKYRDHIETNVVKINRASTRFHEQLTLPNLLTGSRFVIAPLLLYCAWFNHPYVYIFLLCVSFMSDLIDGMAARFLGLESALGAALDTWSDFVIYITLPITSWWLWPELVRQQLPYIIMIVAGYIVPALIGTLKFRSVPSYHTWGAKLAAASVGSTMVLMVLAGPIVPFQVAAWISLLAALEEIFITLVSATPQSDVRSLWHVVVQGYRS